MNDIPKYLRRKRTEEKESYVLHLLLAILIFLFALAYCADQIGMTNVAHAELVKPRMTEKEACQGLKKHDKLLIANRKLSGVSSSEVHMRCMKLGVTLN